MVMALALVEMEVGLVTDQLAKVAVTVIQPIALVKMNVIM